MPKSILKDTSLLFTKCTRSYIGSSKVITLTRESRAVSSRLGRNIFTCFFGHENSIFPSLKFLINWCFQFSCCHPVVALVVAAIVGLFCADLIVQTFTLLQRVQSCNFAKLVTNDFFSNTAIITWNCLCKLQFMRSLRKRKFEFSRPKKHVKMFLPRCNATAFVSHVKVRTFEDLMH